ncbi:MULTISPECIES: hypothetical protein [unclassified Streptomyces]|uniref:DUF11 domain-containing protein n=1 Tax=Streptomyces sp. NBC_00119 TaxID=2975659 RepID=A0AAU1UBA2_9ACTN|nr:MULTISPECIES: hypothetical protein [unclassified Streptomyces]MCX4644208.1 hypothetical protein [Streptomyces sp. NBC_01446]MCX5325320.1 hypothetical protein [Streptomyces sp. NBC_00120]
MQALQAHRAPGRGRALTRRRIPLALVTGAVLALGSVAPASADEPETDALWIAAPYDLVLPAAAADGSATANTIDVRIGHDNTHNSVTGGRLTVDASELAGVADVTWPATCTPAADQATATCDFGSLDSGGQYVGVAGIGLRAAAGAPADATGTLHFTATADSSFGPLTGYPADTAISLGDGPDLGVSQLPYRTGVRPGTDLAQPIRLTNHGNRAADRTLLTLFASHGLDLSRRFGNCTYLDDDATVNQSGTTAVCVLDQPVEPGQEYDLSAAGAVRATGAALYDRFDYSVDPYSDEAYQQALAGRPFVQGTGDDLVPAAVPAARALSAAAEPDLNTGDNYRSTQITADNKADLVAVARDITSVAPGDTVKARVGVKNRGPAWVASLGAGEPVATIDVRLPEGTTVTGKPAGCDATGTNLYTCRTPILLWEKARSTFDFTLRVDRVVDGGAKGSVATRNDDPELRISAFDPKLANNAAEFTISGS